MSHMGEPASPDRWRKLPVGRISGVWTLTSIVPGDQYNRSDAVGLGPDRPYLAIWAHFVWDCRLASLKPVLLLPHIHRARPRRPIKVRHVTIPRFHMEPRLRMTNVGRNVIRLLNLDSSYLQSFEFEQFLSLNDEFQVSNSELLEL